jgi:hypothetical protein
MDQEKGAPRVVVMFFKVQFNGDLVREELGEN